MFLLLFHLYNEKKKNLIHKYKVSNEKDLDFSFGASIASPARDLIDSQISRKTFWRYQPGTNWLERTRINIISCFHNANRLITAKYLIQPRLFSILT